MSDPYYPDFNGASPAEPEGFAAAPGYAPIGDCERCPAEATGEYRKGISPGKWSRKYRLCAKCGDEYLYDQGHSVRISDERP